MIFDRNRNAFLCGFALFLYVMLQRFETLVGDLGKLEKRQAQRAGNSEYLYNFLLVSFLLTHHDPFTRNHPFSHPLPLHCLPFISTITLFHHLTTILIFDILPRFNEEQIQKLKEERAVLVARAEAAGIDSKMYLLDNIVTSSPRVERSTVGETKKVM